MKVSFVTKAELIDISSNAAVHGFSDIIVVGVMKMGNITPRAGFELTCLPILGIVS